MTTEILDVKIKDTCRQVFNKLDMADQVKVINEIKYQHTIDKDNPEILEFFGTYSEQTFYITLQYIAQIINSICQQHNIIFIDRSHEC